MKQIITDEALNKYSLWSEKDRNLELYNTQLLYAVYGNIFLFILLMALKKRIKIEKQMYHLL